GDDRVASGCIGDYSRTGIQATTGGDAFSLFPDTATDERLM
ncbi:MAG: hypothetical protein AVDCRST_MAG93-5362, partial [uncultured Chloroflexia bacterium]